MHEFNTRKDFIDELMPLVKLRQFQNYSNIGCSNIAASHLVSMIALFGRRVFQIRDIVNALYTYAVMYREQDALKSFSLVSNLMEYGDNFLVVDCYFPVLALTHTFMVNRRQFAAATSVERLMRLHLETSRNVQMTA